VEWQVYGSLARSPGGLLTARTIAQQLGLSAEGMQTVLDRLSACGLIHLPELGYEEFRSRSVEPTAPAVAREASAANHAAPAEEKRTSVSFTLRKRPRTTMPATSEKPRTDAPLQLGALLRLVRERAGGGSLGQLAVYRMFLKLPQETLQAAGFEQLDLDTAELEVRDRQLADLLREKASEVLGLSTHELNQLEGGLTSS
jgi:DNA-binding MarR family transcriptional regulator